MRERFHALGVASIMLAGVLGSLDARPALAASCALPAALRIAVEERGGLGRGTALIATDGSCCGLRPGDVVRQANGTRVMRCAELEQVAAEALAKGLALLLGIERDGTLIAVAATTVDEEKRVAARRPEPAPAAAPSRPGATLPAERPESPALRPDSTTARGAVPEPQVRVPEPRATVRPRRAATLPGREDGTRELRQRAAAAAAALAHIDDAANAGVPLVVYERRLGDAEAAIAALEFGVDPADSAVHDFIENAIALHRTARDVRRAQLQSLSRAEVDRRGSAAGTVPYFSDSQVPDWVAAYPFLSEAILEPPHETHMPFPGEASGRWSAERALELLWQRARAATAELATWAQA